MDIFAAVADPNRRRMIELLGCGPELSGAISARFGLSAPAVSQHLKILREAGLVRVQVDGQRRIYSLDPEGFAEFDRWVEKIRGFWGPRLDALEAALKTEKDGK
jgi:DNA-binding transcriptional ArsR family regulator